MADKKNPVRFGILGCAEIARKVCRAINLSPNSTLHAISSRSIEKARQFATKNSLSELVKVYGSYEEVLDDPLVDAVYVPLPTSLHLKWAVLAADKKKHVLLEKPTALNVGELDQILDACESNGVQFMDGSMWYHHPRTARMKELLSDPKVFGQVKTEVYQQTLFRKLSNKDVILVREKPTWDIWKEIVFYFSFNKNSDKTCKLHAPF